MILDKRISEELRAARKQRLDNGSLRSETQLKQYYETFRSRFGPERLAQLDGE